MSQTYFTEDKVRTEHSLFQLSKKVWPFVRRYKFWFFGVIVLVLLFVAIGRSLPFLIQLAIDEGIQKKDLSYVWWIAGVYLVLELLRSVFHYAQTLYIQKLGNRLLYDIREKLMSHIQRLPLNYFDKNPIGRTVTRATNDISSLGELFTEGFTDILVNAIEMVSIIIALSFISPSLTVLAILIAPILIFLSLQISVRIRHYFKESKKKMAAINAYTAESLNGMKIIHLFNQVEPTKRQFDSLSQDYRYYQLKTVKLFALLWPLLESFNMGTVASAIFFGALFQTQLGLSIGELTAFILLLQGFFRPLRVILERYNQTQNAITSADRVFSLIDEPLESQAGISPKVDKLRGEIEYKNLSFRYSKENPYAVQNINLKIAPGESLALVGRTGSGKTTLVSLLQKLYPVTEGDILVDGMSINDLNPNFLRSHMGVVLQDPFMFKGTIASNISLNNEAISEDRIRWAAEKAQCSYVFERRPGGLHAEVEEAGANLSLGERQLIAFARVLAFDPDILVLDEATSNVDSMTEQWVQKAIKEVTQGRTCLIIAHRLSTVLHCNRIAVLHNSKLMEVGSHAELMQLGGLYSELYSNQFSADSKHGRINTSHLER